MLFYIRMDLKKTSSLIFGYGCLLVLLIWSSTGAALAQKNVTISGYIKDGSSGETLIGATLLAQPVAKGAATNAYGFYSLTLPPGEYELIASYIGFQTWTKQINLTENLSLNIDLNPAMEQLEEIIVTAGSLKEKLNTPQMSVEKLTSKEAKQIPALFGEVDIIKTIQLKPGVQSGGEGTSGLYIRGGGPDQNLFVLDEAIVYNASHLFGLFSTFNPDAVKGISLYKGDFPSEYGGRLSSVVDIKLNDGNNRKFGGSGGLGLISSRLTLEGPIQKEKSSFMISGRRTYFDVITRAINRSQRDNPNFNPIPDYYFYDLNAKANFDLGEKDKLFISGYFGRDVFGFSSGIFGIDFNWGNATSTVRWNHIFSPKLFLNTSLIYSDYDYTISNQFSNISFNVGSQIRDYHAKMDFDYIPSNEHLVKFGVDFIHHQFGIGRLRGVSDDGLFDINQETNLSGNEFALYVSDEWKVSDALSFNTGIRFSGFESDGTMYTGWEPRFSSKYSLGPNTSWKASFSRMFQYIHLVANSGASLPTDIWYPSNEFVRPQSANQVATGISHLFGKGKFLISNEVYYKRLYNQVDFRDGAQLFVNPNLNQEFVFGDGWAYGNEIYLEKKEGKTTGWIGYTLSWSERQFDEINNGEKFFYRFDRRHDISIVVIQEINKRLSLTGTWVYGSGNAITLPIGRFFHQDIEGQNQAVVPIYTDRNSFRMPAYHRADIGLVYKFFPKWGESDLTVSIYNAYNRRNPFFLYFDEIRDVSGEQTLRFQAKSVALFPILPSITYNFRF